MLKVLLVLSVSFDLRVTCDAELQDHVFLERKPPAPETAARRKGHAGQASDLEDFSVASTNSTQQVEEEVEEDEVPLVER